MVSKTDYDALKEAVKNFLSWYEDNFGEERWLDGGIWRSNLDLPEYQNLAKLLEG